MAGPVRGLAAAALAALLALGACAGGEPLDYHAIDDLKPGPGMFSGKDGAFVIFRK